MAITLVVEDGTGLATANSYIDEAYFDLFFTNIGNAEAVALETEPKKALLIQATRYIETVYYGAWKGEALTTTQRLSFPRVIDGVTEFPERLKEACCDLAWKANSVTLLVDVEQRVVKEKVASLETVYAEYSDQKTQYTEVYNLLQPYLENSSSYSMKLERT